MLKQLLSHSSDLQRLLNEGFNLEIMESNLLIRQVPYVTSNKVVDRGILVSELSTEGNKTIRPKDHVVFFVGSIPCDDQGRELDKIINSRASSPIGGGLVACCTFSSKPQGGYPDYYEKMTSYVNILLGYARAIDPTVTPSVYPPIATDDEDSPFQYIDSASSRAQISAVTEKFKHKKIAIVGLGGTGSYILDLIAKTPVQYIHLYDEDIFYTHNAFRAPGAASIEELNAGQKKVEYFQSKYNPIHRNIVSHAVNIDESNVDELREMDFVFLAMDTSLVKKLIFEKLDEFCVPFIDTGMGIELNQASSSLNGLIRTTTSIENNRKHVWNRVSFLNLEDDEYERNIQIADLNALNAVLAVIKWKKLVGFYLDLDRELSSTFTIDGNHLLNEDNQECI